MATVTTARQPFAPLNEARLQTLTSLKNRQNQNAIPNVSPGKRKASDVTGSDNTENVDPVLFSKRAKGADGFFPSKDSFLKSPAFFLTKSASTNDLPVSSTNSAQPSAAPPLSRTFLSPASPAAKLNMTSIARPSPLSAPGGRSLTRQRSGGLRSSRRRTGGPFTRADPPAFALPNASSSVAPFSLDAALRGTISSYTRRSNVSSKKSPSSSLSLSSSGLSDYSDLHEPRMKPSWFFDIHEDTVIEDMTNDLNHKTSGLDLMSEEQKRKKLQEEYEEGKENHPPLDDVSQTSQPPSRAVRGASNTDEMVLEKERNPLGEMDPKDYYSEGCDENSIIMVPGDEDEETPVQNDHDHRLASEVEFSVPAVGEYAEADVIAEPEFPEEEEEKCASVEELMQKTDHAAPGAAVLEPLEGTGESFEVWESSSAKDEAEAVSGCC
ncbi:hypothetical protein F4680DRAFT_442188 [Xylaria scruposa]|nr:hypothetical protein F4680DRAFT_442188 [Xylaria scruposa]